jgi:uncharacterized OsmC-like protein
MERLRRWPPVGAPVGNRMGTEQGSSGAARPFGVRVRSSGAAAATAYARVHSFEVGSPLPFDVEEGRVTALEYVLGALGAELVNGFRAIARKRRLAIDEVEATVDGELENPLTHLGVVGETGHPGLARIWIRVHVATLEPEDVVREAWDVTLERSPLLRTMAAAAKIEVTMTVTV